MILSIDICNLPIAVRQAIFPRLRERPVILVSTTRSMGRVLAISPEVDGVEPGMLFPTAKRICPDAFILTRDPALEARALQAIVNISFSYTPRIEAGRGGAIFLGIDGTRRLFGPPLDLAEQLRRNIADQLSLNTVAGLSSRRVWSRLAGLRVTPAGIMEVLSGREQEFLNLIPATWLQGVGVHTLSLMHDLNISHLGQLRRFTRSQLYDVFGPPGHIVADTIATNIVEQPVTVSNPDTVLTCPDKCIEASIPLPEESADPTLVMVTLKHAASLGGFKLREARLQTRQLHLRIDYSDGRSSRGHCRLPEPSSLDSRLTTAAEQIFITTGKRRVRLRSITLTCRKLQPPSLQGCLFSDQSEEQEIRRLNAMDQINQRYGIGSIMSAGELKPHALSP